MTRPSCFPPNTHTRLLSPVVFTVLAFISSAFGIDDPSLPQETVEVHADVQGPRFEPLTGFIHGWQSDDTLNDSLVALLKPRFWRVTKGFNLITAQEHGAVVTYVLSDSYAFYKGGYPSASPWENWTEYEDYTRAYMQALQAFSPYGHPDYYDIWNEPDHPYYWHGTYGQYLETFVRAYDVIKSVDPAAKVVGPSISWFRPTGEDEENIIQFLYDLYTDHGILLDAVSWHENNSSVGGAPPPSIILSDVQTLEYYINTYLPVGYEPELHVNEYTGRPDHLSPGYSLGYLYYLHLAGVDQTARSCWDCYTLDSTGYDYWSDCWAGLNGMFMRDGHTPQPVYWLYKAYAEMENEIALEAVSSSSRTTMFASLDDSTGIVTMLVGRHDQESAADVMVNVTGYPYEVDRVTVTVDQIPSFPQFLLDPPIAQPLPDGPVNLANLSVDVEGGSFVLSLPGFQDGNVMVVAIHPDSSCCRGDRTGDVDVSHNEPNEVDASDLGVLVSYLFSPPGTVSLACLSEADVDARGGANPVDSSDLGALVAFLFASPPGSVVLPECP